MPSNQERAISRLCEAGMEVTANLQEAEDAIRRAQAHIEAMRLEYRRLGMAERSELPLRAA